MDKFPCISIFRKIPSLYLIQIDVSTWLQAFQNFCEHNNKGVYVFVCVYLCMWGVVSISHCPQSISRGISYMNQKKKFYIPWYSKHKNITIFYLKLLHGNSIFFMNQFLCLHSACILLFLRPTKSPTILPVEICLLLFNAFAFFHRGFEVAFGLFKKGI